MCTIGGHSMSVSVRPDGMAAAFSFTQTAVDAKTLVDKDYVNNILGHEETMAIVHYFEGHQPQKFEIVIQLPERVFCNNFTIRAIKSPKTGHTTRVFVVFNVYQNCAPYSVNIDE